MLLLCPKYFTKKISVNICTRFLGERGKTQQQIDFNININDYKISYRKPFTVEYVIKKDFKKWM